MLTVKMIVLASVLFAYARRKQVMAQQEMATAPAYQACSATTSS